MDGKEHRDHLGGKKRVKVRMNDKVGLMGSYGDESSVKVRETKGDDARV